MIGENVVEFTFNDANIKYSVVCYINADGSPYMYSGWMPLEPALKHYEECLKEPWTKRAVLVKRESYYYIEKDEIGEKYV